MKHLKPFLRFIESNLKQICGIMNPFWNINEIRGLHQHVLIKSPFWSEAKRFSQSRICVLSDYVVTAVTA